MCHHFVHCILLIKNPPFCFIFITEFYYLPISLYLLLFFSLDNFLYSVEKKEYYYQVVFTSFDSENLPVLFPSNDSDAAFFMLLIQYK